jgi:2'-hydroxyisoflavone reductase
VHFVDARDLAEWTIRLVEARTLGTFNAMGPASTLTMKGMVDGIRDAIGSKATPVWAPTAFLEQQQVSAWGDMPVWIPAQGDTAGANRRTNGRAIAAGLTFRPLEVTARETLAWWRTLPAERQKELRAGIKPEREQQVLAALEASAAKG